MKFYIKNTNTNETIKLEAESYEQLSKNFRQAPYQLVSDEEKESILLQEAKEAKITQCKAYLDKTDWQITRLADPTSSEPLKEGVAEKRALARNLQDKINACETLEELNAINTNFK